MNQLTSLFKALSDQNRLRIIASLMKYKELCACQITELIQVSNPTASIHMKILISSGLVTSRKEGRWVYYQLCQDKSDFDVLLNWIKTQLNHSTEALNDAKTLEKITAYKPEELCRKQRGEKCCPENNKQI